MWCKLISICNVCLKQIKCFELDQRMVIALFTSESFILFPFLHTSFYCIYYSLRFAIFNSNGKVLFKALKRPEPVNKLKEETLKLISRIPEIMIRVRNSGD